jgi:glycosyltransferase involved in cell wall biosynthesis
VLFLGSCIPRKGIHEILDAATLLRSAPVEFRFVGGSERNLGLAKDSNIDWIGPIARKRVHDFYRNADVFILPTHSDGFGLTQLEAMAWGLPVIASNNCGDVVKHQVNGLIVSKVTAEAISESINWCIENAERLARMSDCAARTSDQFRVNQVIPQLLRCAERPQTAETYQPDNTDKDRSL